MFDPKKCGVLSCNRPAGEKTIPVSQIGIGASIATYRGHCFNGTTFLCCDACMERYNKEDGIRFERLTAK